MLDDLVLAIRRGGGRSLVLRGEAGIGKTALLEHLVETAPDLTVLWAVGVESEMELAYASLQQLCSPLIDRLPGLPEPQRQALETVFGLSSGAAPDRFLVGLAVLSLLSEVAEERALLCVLDDGQWLDQASVLTLAFVARRLQADPVGIVFSVREPSEELRKLPQLEIKGLGDGDSDALLDSAVMFKLDAQVRDRIVAETRGNPLALLELPRGLTATELAGGFGLPDAQELSGRIEESFVRRLEPLPGDTQLLLLLASAEPVGDPLLLWRAAEQLGIGPAAADAAEADALLNVGRRVTFRHPLLRSAVYRSATAEQRRAVHLALAEATDKDTDPDRRAWHLAVAAVGPDETVASELERSAGRAQARGGLAAAAAFLERSVALSADPGRRTERALAAAQVSMSAGAFDIAQDLLTVADAGPLSELQGARVELVRAQLAFVSSHGSDAPALLLQAAKRLEPLDADLARETYLHTLSAVTFAGRAISPSASAADVSRAAREAPSPRTPRAPDLLVDGLATLHIEGRAAAAPILKRALRGLVDDTSAEEALRWLFLASVAAVGLWDDSAWHALCERFVEVGRQVGALSEIPHALLSRAYVHIFSGELDAAAALIGEIWAVTEATGSFVAPGPTLHLAAIRGRESEVLTLIEASSEEMTRRGQASGTALSDVAKAVLYNGLGRYEEALAAAREVGPQDLNTENWAICERIEAARRAGRPDLAADGVRRLHESLKTVAPTGVWGSRLDALLSSAKVKPRRGSIAKPSSGSGAPGCGRSSPARTSSTANGCAVRVGASTPASICARRTTCSR